MKIQVLFFTMLSISFGSAQQTTHSETNVKNLLATISTSDLGSFTWMNPPKNYSIEDGNLMIEAPNGSDFFNNPENNEITATAPFLYTEIEGDFVAKARVQPDFSSQWNAIALMVHLDNNRWIKFAFENSDATGPSIVTVVTKDLSDDANGVVLEDSKAVWLKLIRKGDNYSMLWSKDDSDYKMARLTTLPKAATVKIGLEAQCPVGPSATHRIFHFTLAPKTVKDMRNGL